MSLTRESGKEECFGKVSKCPSHVAIIMDGNGRWAKKRVLNRIKGHKRVLKRLEILLNAAVKPVFPY